MKSALNFQKKYGNDVFGYENNTIIAKNYEMMNLNLPLHRYFAAFISEGLNKNILDLILLVLIQL